MSAKSRFINLFLALCLTMGFFAATPAAPTKAQPADEANSGVSPEELLNADGTLNLDGNFNGDINLTGWDVQMDPARGPIFSLPSAPAVGDWESLGGGAPSSPNSYIHALTVSGSDVYVGGEFTDMNGDPAMDYIAKWDALTGTWSALGSSGAGNGSLNSYVYAIAVYGTDVYVGGEFYDVNNGGTVLTAADYIAKWNGSSWSALNGNGAGDGSLNGTTEAIAIIGSNVYVGGDFEDVNNGGTVLGAADYIAKWNGTNWFALGGNGAGDGSLNSTVYALAVRGSMLCVGGSFTDINNGGVVLAEADYVAEWNDRYWVALGSNGAGNGSLNSSVYALAASGTGDIYVGGYFTNINNGGTVLGAADYIAKWNSSGWSALGGNGAGNGSLNYPVEAISMSGSNVYVGGDFTNVNNGGTSLGAADYLAKWDGTNWSALGSNGAGDGSLNGWVQAIAISGSTVYAGGWFSNVSNGGAATGMDYVARWNGTNWLAMAGAANGALRRLVRVVTVSGTDVYVGGAFVNANNIPEADYIAKWDGANWSALGSNGAGDGSLNYSVEAIAVSGSNVYVGGGFTNVNNGGTVLDAADYIAKWDGSNWSALGSNLSGNGSLNYWVHAIVVSGSNVYVGGNFTNVNNGGTSLGAADYIAKWDSANWSALGSNGAGNGSLNNPVETIAVSGSTLYVGGGFTNVNNGGTSLGAADRIAKWDGANWSALGSNGAGDGSLNGWVQIIAVSGSNVYAGGNFTNVNNGGAVLGAADYIAKWNGSGWSALGGNGSGSGSLGSAVYALAVSGSNLYVGGYFTNVNNGGAVLGEADYIAKWNGANWSALGNNGAGNGSLNYYVNALAASGTALYVGGEFLNASNNGVILPYADYVAAYGIDTVAPTVSSIARAEANPTAAAALDFTVTFSESVTGVDASDFTLTTTGVSSATMGGVSGSGATRTVTVNTGSGNGTIRLDLKASGTGIVDLVGNPIGGGFTGGQVYTVNKTLAFYSTGAQDGWTLESTETSGVGGSRDNAAATFNLGDDAANKQYRGILSFNTASLPDTAVITQVTLKIRQSGSPVGTNPFTILGGLRVDIHKPYFGGSAGLALSDFQAAAGQANIGTIPNAPVSSWYSKVWSTDTFFSFINLAGTTQFRLRFATDDNNDGGADYMRFISGDHATASARPTLIIEYYVP